MKAPSRIATAGDRGELIVGEVFGFTPRRQILNLHLLLRALLASGAVYVG